jgi:hypothetical protein
MESPGDGVRQENLPPAAASPLTFDLRSTDEIVSFDHYSKLYFQRESLTDETVQKVLWRPWMSFLLVLSVEHRLFLPYEYWDLQIPAHTSETICLYMTKGQARNGDSARVAIQTLNQSLRRAALTVLQGVQALARSQTRPLAPSPDVVQVQSNPAIEDPQHHSAPPPPPPPPPTTTITNSLVPFHGTGNPVQQIVITGVEQEAQVAASKRKRPTPNQFTAELPKVPHIYVQEYALKTGQDVCDITADPGAMEECQKIYRHARMISEEVTNVFSVICVYVPQLTLNLSCSSNRKSPLASSRRKRRPRECIGFRMNAKNYRPAYPTTFTRKERFKQLQSSASNDSRHRYYEIHN